MALAWVLAQKGVTSVIIGASSVEQLAQNIKCVNAALLSKSYNIIEGKKINNK